MTILETTEQTIEVLDLGDGMGVLFITEFTITSFIFPEFGLVFTFETERVYVGAL